MESVAGRIVLLWGWRRAAVAFVAGALAVLAQAPFDFFAVCFISFPVLVWLLDGATPEGRPGLIRRLWPAFVTGWWFGFGYFLAGLWWIGNAVLVEAEEFAWALPLAVLVLPALLALFYGFATAAARLVWANDIGRIAALAAGFGLAEWLRAVLFTGFPWNAIGYAAMPVPLFMQPVAAIGLYGVNAVAVFVFAMPALIAARRGRLAGLVSVVAIVAAATGFGLWRLGLPAEAGRTVSVRIVQPSIDQAGKWDATLRDEIFARQIGLSGEPPAEGAPEPRLIVWPETSVPFLFTDRPDALAAIGELLSDDQVLLAGAVRVEAGAGGAERYYNSVIAIDGGGEIAAAADKVHLVPFGEYLPLADLLGSLGLRQFVNAPGVFSPGSSRSMLEVAGGVRLLPMICYEIIFPGELDEADSADAIVNITNDAWYGDTPGPYQHFRQAQVRAVEAGLPLIRAANNGISAVVDARGRIVDAFGLNVVGNIDASVSVGRFPVLPYRGYTFIAILLIFATIACTKQLLSKVGSN
ncbi:MAG: apolipoprotein N-acyltransferase [Rhizobiaceae bacterium]